MDTMKNRLQVVKSRIDAARTASDGYARDIVLVAISKGHGATALRQAYGAGQRDFGESYLQEALDKMAALVDLPIRWHFVGPIQSNKTRAIAEHFDWVHSVDRFKVAQRLSAQRP
ncbi:MAG TPA: YggS family pyridoxal phosphate-dependent enzyme, partial [Burkholderiales bacterium]